MISKEEFEVKYLNIFNIEKMNFTLKFEMGENLEENARVNQVLERSKEIMNFLLSGKDIWIRLTLWNFNSHKTDVDLLNVGFKFEDADNVFELQDKNFLRENEKEDAMIYYLYYKEFDFEKIRPLLMAIACYELAIEPSANITAYIVNFGDSLLINLYDDRGLEIVFKNLQLMRTLYNKFERFISEDNRETILKKISAK